MLLFDSDIGRLGNQMFMYAAARSIAKAKGVKYAITDFRKLTYFNLTWEDRNLNELKKTWWKYRIHRYGLMKSMDLTDCWVDQRPRLIEEPGHRKVYGYFQGDWYFKDNAQEIQKCFDVKPQYQKRFQKVYEERMRGKKTAVIHIRRTDYLEHTWLELGGEGFALPLSYYKDQIDELNDGNTSFIFVSDDISFAEEQFAYLENAWFSHEDEITDMQIIMHGDICILSNSSFSWWGGWLNKNPNKEIRMPRYYCGFKVEKEYPINIIPDSFRKIEVNYQKESNTTEIN